MAVQTRKYKRRSFPVEAVLVTDENMKELARWSKGQIKRTKGTDEKPSAPYIKLKVHRPQNERQTRAFAGDHIVVTANGYRVYPPASFEKTFYSVEGEDSGVVAVADIVPAFQPAGQEKVVTS